MILMDCLRMCTIFIKEVSSFFFTEIQAKAFAGAFSKTFSRATPRTISGPHLATKSSRKTCVCRRSMMVDHKNDYKRKIKKHTKSAKRISIRWKMRFAFPQTAKRLWTSSARDILVNILKKTHVSLNRQLIFFFRKTDHLNFRFGSPDSELLLVGDRSESVHKPCSI